MQRLGDIVARDLAYIMETYRDFTKSMVIQCGSIKHTVYGSLQDNDVEFSSDVAPVNAFSHTLYFIDPKDSAFTASLKQNAIIYVDSDPYKIIDSAHTMGLAILSLEKKGGR